MMIEILKKSSPKEEMSRGQHQKRIESSQEDLGKSISLFQLYYLLKGKMV
jgi:hypothetical protein